MIVKPVSGMLMTGNMLELWNNLVDTSNDPLGYTPRKVPSLMFADVVVNQEELGVKSSFFNIVVLYYEYKGWIVWKLLFMEIRSKLLKL